MSEGPWQRLARRMSIFEPVEYDLTANSTVGRGIQGALQLPDTILRGIFNIGKATVQDAEFAGASAVNAVGRGGKRTQRVLDRGPQGPELLGEIGKSFVNTGSTLGDLAYVPSLMRGIEDTGSFSGGVEAANERFGQRVREFDEDPAMFLLEHVGNVAIGGALAAKPAQAGLAASRGAMTGRQAARAMRPLAGQEARATARHFTAREAAAARESGRKLSLPQAIHFADNAISHPYITAGKKLADSTPAHLARNPLARADAVQRFRAPYERMGQRLRGEEVGELNFRADDPRRRWNEVQDELGSADLYAQGSDSPKRTALQQELETLKTQFRSRGIDLPADGGLPGSGANGRFDPTDPRYVKDVTAETDFQWMEPGQGAAGGFGTSDDFVESVLRPVKEQLAHEGRKAVPDRIEVLQHTDNKGVATGGSDVFYTSPDGEIVGVLSVDPAGGMNIGVDPRFRNQGIATRLSERAMAEGLPVSEAAKNTTFSPMGSGFTNKVLGDIPEGSFTRPTETPTNRFDATEVSDTNNRLWSGTLREVSDNPQSYQATPNEVSRFNPTIGRDNVTIHVANDASGNPSGAAWVWRRPDGEIYDLTVVSNPEARGQGFARKALDDVEASGVNVQELLDSGKVQFTSEGAEFANRYLNRETSQSGFSRETGPDQIDILSRMAGEEGALFPRGTGSTEARRSQRVSNRQTREARLAAGEHTVGPIDLLANEIGLGAKTVRGSNTFQQTFGTEARGARNLVKEGEQAMNTGTGDIADRSAQVADVVGNQNLRRQHDPSRVERMFLRDISNLSKRPDADRYANLIRDIPQDRITPQSVPSRVADVSSGNRAIGQTLGPDELLARVNRVVDEARVQSAGNPAPDAMSQALRDILPGVEPMGLYLMALDAADLSLGLNQGTLSGALGDFVQMDRFADLSRRAQASMRGTEFANMTPERFRLPEDMLDVDINAMPQQVQDMFYGAAEQYRTEVGTVREPTLVDAGVIPQSGTRMGLDPNEPTQFSNDLADLPLDKTARGQIRDARQAVDSQREIVVGVEKTLREIENSGRAFKERNPDIPLTYRNNRPTQASLDRAWRTTPTGAARKRWRERLGQERETLVQAAAKLDDLENRAVIDPSQAPASARNLLTYSNEVAPQQAEILRNMAKAGEGNPEVLRGIAAELDAMPRTLEDLNSAEVYITYLRDVKGRRIDGSYGPGSSRPVDTRTPAGARRRDTAATMDVRFERDFRTRAYWQDSEFQNFFIKREMDNSVINMGLAKTGRARLIDSGIPEEQLAGMSKNQIQQAMEDLGYRTYEPDKLFGSARKPQTNANPLDVEWVSPYVADILTKALDSPSYLGKVFGEGVWDPLTQSWKVVALPLRPAWQVNNFFGGAFLTMMPGKVSPFDYPSLMRASYRAVNNWNKGIVSEIEVPLHGSYRAELTAKLNTVDPASNEASLIRGFLDEGKIRISNEVLNDISSKGITKGDFAFLNNSQFMRNITNNKNILRQHDIELPKVPGEIGRRGRNLRQTAREGVDSAYHLNETVDNFHRAAVYMDKIGKGYTHAQALAQVNKALGDYSKLNRFERRVVKRIYPFYPWMQHMARVVASSVHPTNIQRTVVTAHVLSVLGEPNEQEEMLPDWAGGHIYVGDAEDGTPKFVSSRGTNPFLDVLDPIAQPNLSGLLRPIHPALQYLYEQISGVSTLTNRPFSNSGSGMTRPPTSEYVFKSIPQLGAARDLYRDLQGQPLRRYGTGEPILGRPGQDTKSGAQSVTRLLGLNIQPMDVESMDRQEKLREYQEEANRRRQEVLKEREGGRTLSDLGESIFSR